MSKGHEKIWGTVLVKFAFLISKLELAQYLLCLYDNHTCTYIINMRHYMTLDPRN